VLILVGRPLLWRLRRPGIELSAHPLRAGTGYHLCVQPSNPANRPPRLELVCEESWSQGKSGARHVAFRRAIALAPGPDQGGGYHGQLQVPIGMRGSFALEWHEVRWYLEPPPGPWPHWRVRYPVTVEAASGPSPAPPALGPPRREESR